MCRIRLRNFLIIYQTFDFSCFGFVTFDLPPGVFSPISQTLKPGFETFELPYGTYSELVKTYVNYGTFGAGLAKTT